MNYQDKITANAILEHLTDDSLKTFDREKARQLIEILPIVPMKNLSVEIKTKSKGKSQEGYAPGIGNVSLKDDKSKTKVLTNQNEPLRIGGFKVFNDVILGRGTIKIDLMWNETDITNKSPTAYLNYEPLTKEPIDMRLTKTVKFFFISFGYPTLWKLPH